MADSLDPVHLETGWRRLSSYLHHEPSPVLRAVHGMRHGVDKVSCGVHSHKELEIVFHASGCGVTRLGELGEIRFKDSSFVLYAPEQNHDQVMDEKGRDVCLQIEVPSLLSDELKGALYIPVPPAPWVVVEIEALTRDQAWANPSERGVVNLRATAVLLSLLQTVVADARRDSMSITQRHIAEADLYLRNHFLTINSLQEVADRVGISHSRLRHLFQEQHGKSMIRRLSEIRLERARSLLVYSRLSIKEVAALSGFQNQYYFSAAFRRVHHRSPKDFRESKQPIRAGRKRTKFNQSGRRLI